jgi:hypothetical protein
MIIIPVEKALIFKIKGKCPSSTIKTINQNLEKLSTQI